jgi:hypothetical protein
MAIKTDLVSDAIEIMNADFLPNILKRLDKEEQCGTATITINVVELDILRRLVSDRIGELHREWYNTTHDDSYDDMWQLAYSLAQTESHERQVQKLYAKLYEI